jgi:hypothetical protein
MVEFFEEERNFSAGLPSLFNVNSAVLVSICIHERLSKSGLPIDGWSLPLN